MSVERPLLELLAAACQNHRITQHKNGLTKFDEEMSPACQRDLKLLNELLPKVEAACCKDVHSIDVVGHLCDFYNDVLKGGFCPHAPNLFMWGDSGSVFKRIHCLMEHLVSKRMLHRKSTALSKKISGTIAHLLSFDASLQQTIAQDLVNFCFDLSVIHEAKLLDANATVRVELFSETAGSESDYCLEVGSIDAVHASQASVISIILEFATRSRSHRLDSEGARRNADARFDWRKSMPIILGCLRQILLAQLDLAPTKAAMLSLRPKVAALELLREIVLEWQEIGSASDLEEVIFIVVAAIRWYFLSFSKLNVCIEGFAELLHNLFLDTTLIAPHGRGGWTHDLCEIHSLILPSLFGFISHIPLILTTGVDNEVRLCNLILQSIDLVMINNTALMEGAAHHCATHGAFPALFKLLSVSNVDTRVASIKILQTLVDSRGPSILSTSCRFAILALEQHDEAESEVKDLPKTTPRKASSPTRKRKVVSISPRGCSPVKLVFEPSPKRNRSDHESATASPKNVLTENLWWSATVSLSDSFRVFFAGVLVKSEGIQRKCQQIPSSLNPLDVDGQLLLSDLSGCVSAICLLLPMMWSQQESEDLLWVSRVVTLLFEALSVTCVVLEGACHVRRQNLGPEDDRLAKLVGLVVDIGLQTHLGSIRSSSMGRQPVDDCFLKFWEVSSRCAWAAMARFARVVSPSSVEYFPWQAFCHQCCFMMRLLNIARPQSRPCLCTLNRRVAGSSEGLHESRLDLEGSKLPFSVKLISYALARPCIQRMNHDAGTEHEQIHVICMPVWKKVDEIIKGSDWETNDSPSLFAVAFLALLPSIVVTATRDVFRGTKIRQVTGRDKIGTLDGIYRSVCVSFPHEKLTMLLGSIHYRLRIGALIGVQHYRLLLRSDKWVDCESTDISFALLLPYFTGGDFVAIVGAMDQEPHHSSSSIDRSLRLSLLSMSTEHDQNMSPVDRLSKWRILKDVVLQSSLLELQSSPTVPLGFADALQDQQVLTIPAVIANMMWVPFADTDYQVRLSASREFGKFMLERSGHVLQSAFGCGDFGNANKGLVDGAKTADTLSCMFKEIDRLIFHHSCMRQSQLSSTFTALPGGEIRSTGGIALEYQHTALRTIASLCQHAHHDDPYGHLIFNHALLRLVRFWVSLDQYAEDNDGDLSGTPLSGLSFSEMRRLASICDFSNLSSAKSLRAFVPALYSEVLLPAAVTLVSETGVSFGDYLLQRQFSLLYSFLESLVVSSPEEGASRWDKLRLLHGSVSPGAIACFVDESLHYAIPSMIINKDYDGIRLATGFKLFVLSIHGNSSAALRDCIVGASIRGFTTRAFATARSRHGIEEQTKLLCLQPKLIQRILPRLLIDNTDRSQLVFFLHIVLQKEMSLQELIASSDKAILRELIWELGGSSSTNQQAIQALKVAALARENATRDSAEQGFGEPGPLKSLAHTMASRWVSSHFMFLLVNIVQLKWQDRTLDDQLKALRSLDLMLQFLLPSEAPRFLTQLVATISTAMSQDLKVVESTHDGAKVWHLRYLAARSLATYVDIMVDGHLQILGQNLTTVVVSLFPALMPPEKRANDDAEEVKIKTEAGGIAVQILEVLTHGKIGKELSQYFKEIPFLPSTSLLDKIMENLKSNGVDFDRLLILSGTQTTQRILTAKDGTTTETAKDDKEGILPPLSDNLLAAMQTRLSVVRPLLSQESASVRIVALQHLIDLLRANRYLFSRLIEKEDPSTAASVLTVQFASNGKYETRGAVTALVEALLYRVMVENNKKVRLLLGSCLGEVAAIDPHRLGAISTIVHRNEQNGGTTSSVDGRFWQLLHPPWKSSPREYALYLLTQLLVHALKAASTSAEQHKVAHTIQQLLAIADEGLSWTDVQPAIDVRTLVASRHSSLEKRPMSQWLRKKLENEGVLNILEPYWASSFSESVKSGKAQGLPFFSTSKNYFQWISRWCRHMILRSGENSIRCNWCRLLFSCRTAVRSSAGTAASEFILPVLVLERLCSGSSDDDNDIQKELQDTFRLAALPIDRDSPEIKMSFRERQKAVNTAFLLVDTLKLWSEHETEGFFSPRQGEAGTRLPISFEDATWNSSLALEKINDLVDALPLEDMAKAAAALGMHARALQCLEAKARMGLVIPAFDSGKALPGSGDASPVHLTVQDGFGPHLLHGIDLSLLKEVLGNLDDYPTMKALPKNGFSKVYDKNGIREREARGDWAGALNDYERALQSESNAGTRSCLERGSLRCLLEMGQYESVLNQVNGILCTSKVTDNENETNGGEQAISLAIDAAWRLGRWSVLDALVREHGLRVGNVHAASDFQLAVGKAMLGLHKRSKSDVENALCVAREVLMTKLSSVAAEGYERAYPSLVRLQCLKEIEDVNVFFSEEICAPDTNSCAMSKLASSSDVGGWAWDIRLNMASHVDTSIITDVRLALARLAGDLKLERDVFFTMGKKARKSSLLDVASTCFAQAQSVSTPSIDNEIGWIGKVQMQLAKLEYQAGQTSAALLILGVVEVKGWGKLSDVERRCKSASRFRKITGRTSVGSDQEVSHHIATRLLKSTRWIAEGGLKAVPEIMESFRVANQLRPKWEKSHFEFGKYLDSLLEARIFGVAQHEGWSAEDASVRQYALSEDMNCQHYLHMAMEQYLEALKASDKHVYQALPRVLSLWFEYTSVERRGSRRGRAKQNIGDTPLKPSSDPNAFLRNKQEEANQLFHEAAARIPSSMFYTATPQLISRLCHPNPHTALAVQTLLTRVLSKFPGQAMWALAWVRNSLDKTRSSLGNEIFHSAQKSIIGWAANDKRVEARRKELFEKNRKILVASKSLVSYLIDISKYLPKDERARSFKLSRWRGEVELCDFVPPVQTALATPLDTTKGRDPFPRFRAIHTGVQIMSSKAKPKRVKFYVVPTTSGSLASPGVASGPAPEDIGELHFLVKNEAKGDLRKDARVQDLNNVINRIMASAEKGKRQRRLRLQTFAVTCLSEDCGLVEWVPNTESFRSLASKSYNPQVPTYSTKRRGKRIANFGDPSLKKNFDDCQNMFFKNGDLSTAARMFEEHFLYCFPPLFYWWFVQNFMDAHAWYDARTNFTTSTAVWSAVGHIIGLGDRHSENLLIDTASGGCVHVDFDCIFDKGLLLPKPEIIPFRLTPNMIDAFGPVGANGIFADSLNTAMAVLRDNRDTLLSVLEPFVKDPIIDWKKGKGNQRQGSNDTGVRDTTQAKLSLKVIDERLRGIYNLRNPNLKRITRTDQVAIDNDEDMARMIPLSVEGQVHKMIAEATCHENLVQLYIGWMPWI